MAAKPGAESARRALDMLFAFEEQPVATVKQLAELVGVPVPSAHRYVALLKEMSLIEEARHGQYRLTMRVVSLSQSARRATSLVDTAQPFMDQLHDQTQETILLTQAIAKMPVCIHRVEARSRLRLSFEVGQPLPTLRGATAHLLLSAIPQDDRRQFVEDAIAHGAAPPLHSIDAFLEEVERDGARGWSISSGEIDDGVWGAAALVRGAGDMVGTLVVPCPAFRVTPERQEEIVAAVRSTADRLSAVLSG